MFLCNSREVVRNASPPLKPRRDVRKVLAIQIYFTDCMALFTHCYPLQLYQLLSLSVSSSYAISPSKSNVQFTAKTIHITLFVLGIGSAQRPKDQSQRPKDQSFSRPEGHLSTKGLQAQRAILARDFLF